MLDIVLVRALSISLALVSPLVAQAQISVISQEAVASGSSNASHFSPDAYDKYVNRGEGPLLQYAPNTLASTSLSLGTGVPGVINNSASARYVSTIKADLITLDISAKASLSTGSGWSPDLISAAAARSSISGSLGFVLSQPQDVAIYLVKTDLAQGAVPAFSGALTGYRLSEDGTTFSEFDLSNATHLEPGQYKVTWGAAASLSSAVLSMTEMRSQTSGGTLTWTMAVVPEPSSLSLMLLGLGGAALARGRQLTRKNA